MDWGALIAAGLAGLLLGAGAIALLAARRQQAMQLALDAARGENSALAGRHAAAEAALQAERARQSERQTALDEARAAFVQSFSALSAEALQRNNQAFLDLARSALETQQVAARGELEKRQQAIVELVAPVRSTLEKFEQQVHGLEKSRIDAYAALSAQVRGLAETQAALRSETGNLVKALRAPQTRGRWGELQLKRVVEMAGMLDHCDFYEQESANGEDGRLRPDLIVRLPGGKNIVVDAKAPLAAYLEALETEEPEAKRRHLENHARQVREHLIKLGRKAYWEQFQPSPDFVVLFLPGETFYSAALEVEPGLIEQGVEQRVILATPTTLIALLRAVAYGWTQQALTDNAERISVLGRELYERLGTVAEHWAGVGKNLNEAVGAYNKAVASLESRVLVSARRFRELKAAPEGKDLRGLNPIESQTRPLSAPELAAAPESTDRLIS